ncbi:MAG: hypothetical protein H6563_11970 [Lewinellaceae bacterium]|nr:hypothetical protein [Lewinellaceae bacterium]
MKKSIFTEKIEAIRRLIEHNLIEDALKFLEELIREMRSKDLIKEITQLQLQFNDLQNQLRNGAITPENKYIHEEPIVKSLLELVIAVEEIGPLPITSNDGWGRLMHNIPQKMVIQERTTCIVRVAKDDNILLKNFEKTGDITFKDIPITKLMEVELEDNSGEAAFLIERVNADSRQFTDDGFYTEWVFNVIPKKSGAHKLAIKVWNVQTIEGEKVKREMAYFSSVTVVASMMEAEADELASSWKDTDIIISKQTSPSKRGLLSILNRHKKNAAAVSMVILSLAAFGAGGYWLWKKMNPPAPPKPPESVVEKIKPTLSIDNSLIVDSVFLGQKAIDNWIANSDTSEIYLPEQDPGQYAISVTGKNGVCSGNINLSKDSTRFVLACSVKANNPPPAPSEFDVSIITLFRDPLLKVDNVEKVASTQTVPDGPYFKTVYRVKKGTHKFEVRDLSGLFQCTNKEKNIHRNEKIQFDCTKQLFEISLFISGQNAIASPDQTWAIVDGIKVVPSRYEIMGDNLMLLIIYVPAGPHTFKADKSGNHALPCDAPTLNISSNSMAFYPCQYIFVGG